MASDRIQRQIERLLDEAEDAFDQGDWDRLSDRANRVLLLDAENSDALSFLTAAERALATTAPTPTSQAPSPTAALVSPTHVLCQWPLPGQGVAGRGRQEKGLPGPRHDVGP